jgi:hypothetical protein
MLTVW